MTCPLLNCARDLLRAPGPGGRGRACLSSSGKVARILHHRIWHLRGTGTRESQPPIPRAAVISLPGFQRNCWGQGGHIYGQNPHGPAEDNVQGLRRFSGLRPMCVIGSAGRKIKTSPSCPSPPPKPPQTSLPTKNPSVYAFASDTLSENMN